jgi:hypothetical protein
VGAVTLCTDVGASHPLLGAPLGYPHRHTPRRGLYAEVLSVGASIPVPLRVTLLLLRCLWPSCSQARCFLSVLSVLAQDILLSYS